MDFKLSKTPFEIAPHRATLLRHDAGGYCSFEGWVRDHHLGKKVLWLEYEAYPALAEKQGHAVLAEACERFDLLDVAAIHRVGKLEPGELAVWIGVCAAHRDAAFEACRWLIDTIKATVPVWKHEFYADGSNVWVDPTDCSCAQHHHHSPAATTAHE